ncbi:hypothetical protein TgHK011_003773 [Trichoderma gracile]|nr:hypothetical protein TgHK011_003773 [Trichoderma gracile]
MASWSLWSTISHAACATRPQRPNPCKSQQALRHCGRQKSETPQPVLQQRLSARIRNLDSTWTFHKRLRRVAPIASNPSASSGGLDMRTPGPKSGPDSVLYLAND